MTYLDERTEAPAWFLDAVATAAEIGEVEVPGARVAYRLEPCPKCSQGADTAPPGWRHSRTCSAIWKTPLSMHQAHQAQGGVSEHDLQRIRR